MSEPLDIVAAIETALAVDTRLPLPGASAGKLAGRRIVVTSGPTHEPIDPVRFIANRSSGKQGHAIARAAADAGAEVVLVSGPVAIADPVGVTTHHVESARDMLSAVESALPADAFVAVAAVADWRVSEAAAGKIKKSGAPRALDLVENPDILASVARRNHDRPRLVVGFAAETHDLLRHAEAKLKQKGCDLMLLNDVGAGTATFGGDLNEVTVLAADGTSTAWPRLGKAEVAARLVEILADRLA